MLSTFPATISADSFLGNPFPPFEAGFPPWEYHEPPPFLFHPQDEPVGLTPKFSQEPASSNSGSDTQNPAPSSGSDDPDPNESKTSKDLCPDGPNRKISKNKRPGPDETSGLGCVIDDRKLRRMKSNRESARRSRMRKQKHLENLRNQANRLKVGNREQMNRLRFVVHQTQLFRRENECLRTEAAMLRQRLWDIRQVLVVRQLQLLNPTAMH